jgi:hypothetical protein
MNDLPYPANVRCHIEPVSPIDHFFRGATIEQPLNWNGHRPQARAHQAPINSIFPTGQLERAFDEAQPFTQKPTMELQRRTHSMRPELSRPSLPSILAIHRHDDGDAGAATGQARHERDESRAYSRAAFDIAIPRVAFNGAAVVNPLENRRKAVKRDAEDPLIETSHDWQSAESCGSGQRPAM